MPAGSASRAAARSSEWAWAAQSSGSSLPSAGQGVVSHVRRPSASATQAATAGGSTPSRRAARARFLGFL